ncbi:MAG: xanthine dehydrogenase family protein subunit M [Deltaproteobacteria bacterium]|nr:xanthine dehydrogenase family protein subunit M [Deltaproteobacteria bacterium]
MMNLERHAANSIDEAIALLSKHGDRARLISGGTDLLVRMKKREAMPEIVVSIEKVKGLDKIVYDKDEGLRIGALATLRSIHESSLIKTKFGVLAQAAGMLGTPTIRNQATIGGNLCNAAPSADTAPALMVMGAKVRIHGPEGQTVMPIEDFFKGPGQTALNHDQILTEIQVPDLPANSGAAYQKQTRSRGADLAIVGVAAYIEMENQVIKEVRIALGAVAPTPVRARKTEEVLKGKSLDDTLLDEAGKTASGESKPIDDVRGSANYRQKLVAVLTRRAVTQAAEQI